MKRIVILGATGSVGTNTLAVVRDNPGSFEVAGIAARRASDSLAALAKEFPGAAVAMAEEDDGSFGRSLSAGSRRAPLYSGADAATRLVRETETDICVAAMGGTAGLHPAFAAAEKGLRILLANKEVLVSAGRLFMDAVRAGGAKVLPLDSEHTALWQCLEGRDRDDVERLVITASGGPFRTWTAEQMAEAAPADAINHPVWRMGAKISVDSATLANKALEVIEAHVLFGIAPDAIDILVHPQSAVHGMVEFTDGSVLAHMGVCDMRQPISYMLFYPRRRPVKLPRFDLARIARLDFAEPDSDRFPHLKLGLDACRKGGGYPALYNAANETAVELFLRGRLTYPGMALALTSAMSMNVRDTLASLDDVTDIHEQARQAVLLYAKTYHHAPV